MGKACSRPDGGEGGKKEVESDEKGEVSSEEEGEGDQSSDDSGGDGGSQGASTQGEDLYAYAARVDGNAHAALVAVAVHAASNVSTACDSLANLSPVRSRRDVIAASTAASCALQAAAALPYAPRGGGLAFEVYSTVNEACKRVKAVSDAREAAESEFDALWAAIDLARAAIAAYLAKAGDQKVDGKRKRE